MANRNKHNQQGRAEETRPETRCPDFNLSPLRKYRLDVLLPLSGDDKLTVQLKGFALAVALAFNDSKDVRWVSEQLKKGKPTGPSAVHADRGQGVAMGGGF